ncbi:MFS transporter [Agromyces agglutinans]|uniref:MFS transporter n=1 Tax=Agromyces agglutinans TaxID=2662258 RepID=UPI0028AD9459|nr:MFS transporter [Agromyces agglutinans]
MSDRPAQRSDRHSRAPHGSRAWRNAVFAVFFLSGLSMATWVARIPAIRDFTGLSTQGVGLVILGMSIGSILGLVVAPLLLARWGTRVGEMLTLGIVSVGLLLIGLGGSVTPSVALVVTGLALFGFGNGAVDVIMNVDGAMAEKEIGKTLMPLMHAFFSFGTVAGAGLAVVASAIDLAVIWHFGAVAVLIAIAIVVAVRFVPRDSSSSDAKQADASAPRRPWRERLRESLSVWADSGLLLIGAIMLSMSFAEGSANDWIALAAVDGHGYDQTTGALVFTVFTISMTVARVLGGPVLDRFGRVAVLRVLSATGVVGLGLFIFGTEPWMIVVGTALWAVGCSLGFPVGMSAAADDPHKSAARVSAVAIIGYCAFLAGPPLLGFLGEHFGLLNALLVLMGLMVVAGLLAPAAREKSRRPAA